MEALHESAKTVAPDQLEVAKPPGDEARGGAEHDQDGDADEKLSAEASAVFGRSIQSRRRAYRRRSRSQGHGTRQQRPVKPTNFAGGMRDCD